MITQRFLDVYGIVGVVFMVAVFVVVWFKMVPESFYLPLLVVAVAFWGSRIVMRIFLAKREKQEGEEA